jgi:hypothetical protein
MKQSLVSPQKSNTMHVPAGKAGQRRGLSSLSRLRLRASIYGLIAALILIGLIAIGSRGFHWFDASLIGYAVATVFVVAAVTYKYMFWLARPPTGRYFFRSWQLFFSFENFRRYTSVIPTAFFDLFSQQFIRRRGFYRWLTHQCIFWGVILSCLITFPLTFGWLRFVQTATGWYQIWFFGFPLITFALGTALAFVVIHALDFTAALLLFGLILAFHRRFHDLALVSVQRFGFDIVPLALLMSIVISGLALTADSVWLAGEYYWFISLVHEAVVVLWLISLPFGKFFHLIERPATVGIELYWRTGEGTEMQKCARCGEEFAPARFIQDLKKTLHDVDENYALPVPASHVEAVQTQNDQTHPVETRLWWQDICPRCKRVMRAQANLAALGREGNQFL